VLLFGVLLFRAAHPLAGYLSPRSEIKEGGEARGTFAEGSTRWPGHTP
jgi:hypothetical protein